MEDVLVVGAGYSGLIAAYNLFKKGFQVTLLEARNRVGGRTLEAIVSDKMRLELGGQYISTAQKCVSHLVQEMGLETYSAWGEGDNFIFLDDHIVRYRLSPIESLVTKLNQPQEVRQEIDSLINILATMFNEVPAEAPWKCPKASEWDNMTFHSWLQSKAKNPLTRDFFRLVVNQGFSTEPEQVSLLQMLWFFKTSHGLPRWALGGSQANRIKGGTQLLAEKLAEILGERIVYNQPVIDISQDAQGVHVKTDKKLYHAKAVIVCVPPQLINQLHYTPSIPSDLYRAFAAMQTGNSMKVQAVYEKPFWREKGWSGNGISFVGPQTFTYDNSSPEGKPGVLLGFLTARRATEWNQRPKEERRFAVLKTWSEIFGSEALEPLEYIEMDWAAEPYSRGGHGCHFPPGVWSELGPALGEKHMPQFGRIFWAASDLAKDWNGYLEGAISAGEQAVQEVENQYLKGEIHAGSY